VFVFLLLPAFADWLGTLQTAAMHETKESGPSAVSAACCIGWLCDYLKPMCLLHTQTVQKNAAILFYNLVK